MVENKSGETVYIKPENDGVGNGPGGKANVPDNSAQKVEAGQSVYGLVDGVKTSKYSNAIFKLVTGSKVTVTQGGDVSFRTIWGAIKNSLTGGWLGSLNTPGSNFTNLYKAPVGKHTWSNYNYYQHYNRF